MYIIDRSDNSIQEVQPATFKELGFREREHLQEWIAKNPSCLGEDLLIIQKEFDGFNETNERLDLLALDKQGNLVIIENKLDDSGRDVTWQVLKYASYCSSLSSTQIIDIFNRYLNNGQAREVLEEFFDSEDFEKDLNTGNSQRIIMVAGEYRKEVTSTVLWLMNYGLRVQLFKATPFRMETNLLLNVEQVIPVPEAADFVISMAEKNRANIQSQQELKERHVIRMAFWEKMIDKLDGVTNLYNNINPTKDHWLSAGSGISGIRFSVSVSGKYVRIELSISRGNQEENKKVFDYLKDRQDKIEADFGNSLEWERLTAKKMSRIKYEQTGISVFDEKNWEVMLDFISTHLPKLEIAMKTPLQAVKKIL